MRILLAVLVLCFAATIPRSAMATSPPTNPIHLCLGEIGADFETARACIGQGASACIETDGGVTTIGMIQCHDQERAAWRALRDGFVDSLRRRESAAQISMLDETLAAHARWTNVRCAYGASIYEGGSMARVLAAACANRLEAELAIDLRSRLAEYDER